VGWFVAVRGRLWTPPAVLGVVAGYLLVALAVFEGTRVALPLTPMLGLTLFVGVYRLLGAGEERREG